MKKKRANPAPQLRAHLGMITMAERRPSPQAVVLKKGLEFESTPLTQDEITLVNKIAQLTIASFGDFKAKECFSNAQKFLYNAQKIAPDADIRYIEGYFAFASLPIPIHHGWISFNNKLIDLTLTQSEYDSKLKGLKDRIVGIIPTEFEYIGIPIDTEDIIHKIEHDHETYMILDDWRPQFRKLRAKYVRLN